MIQYGWTMIAGLTQWSLTSTRAGLNSKNGNLLKLVWMASDIYAFTGSFTCILDCSTRASVTQSNESAESRIGWVRPWHLVTAKKPIQHGWYWRQAITYTRERWCICNIYMYTYSEKDRKIEIERERRDTRAHPRTRTHTQHEREKQDGAAWCRSLRIFIFERSKRANPLSL